MEKPITQEVIQRVEELAKLKIANDDVIKEMWSEIEACYAKYKDESSEENIETALDENEVHSRYEVEFPDGSIDEVEANMIAESMITECDPEGSQYKLFKEISDHRKDETALNVADG